MGFLGSMFVGKNAKLKPVTVEQVVIGRKEFVKGEVTVRELAQRWERGHEWVRLALRGKIFPKTEAAITGSLTRCRRHMTDKQVIEARRAYVAGEIKQEEIATKYGLSQTRCSSMLFGKTYKDIGEAVTARPNYRRLTDKEVLEARRAYAAKEVNQNQLAAKYNLHQKTISWLLRGKTYKHLPGAVPDGNGQFQRKLTDEQVLAARKAFRTRQIAVKHLADYYRLDRAPMQNILVGKSYKNVPLAVRRIADFAPKRAGNMKRLRYIEAMTEAERALAKRTILGLLARYGGTRGLADAVGVKIHAVQKWRKQGCAARNTHEQVAEITGVPKEHLRPDMHRPTGKPYYGLPTASRDEIGMLIMFATTGRIKLPEDEEAA
jgi:hypothetical protein